MAITYREICDRLINIGDRIKEWNEDHIKIAENEFTRACNECDSLMNAFLTTARGNTILESEIIEFPDRIISKLSDVLYKFFHMIPTYLVQLEIQVRYFKINDKMTSINLTLKDKGKIQVDYNKIANYVFSISSMLPEEYSQEDENIVIMKDISALINNINDIDTESILLIVLKEVCIEIEKLLSKLEKNSDNKESRIIYLFLQKSLINIGNIIKQKEKIFK